MNRALTHARLVEVLNYDANTGVFTWKKSTSKRPVEGKVAGHDHGNGYLKIGIDGVVFAAHRLAWMYVHGVFPKEQIDHRNGDRANNAIANLREATNYENQQNQRPRSGKRSIGTHRSKSSNRWTAQIGVNGKQIHLGSFRSEEEASQAYLAAKAEHHPFQTLVEVAK